MTGFFIGMLAFALWVGVMIGIYRSVKANPGHPFWSMALFKNARRSIAPTLTPPVSPEPLELSVPEAGPIEPAVPVELDFDRVAPVLSPPLDDDLIVLRGAEEERLQAEEFQELEELEAMLSSISQPTKPRAPRSPRKRATGPVRSGRLTYVLVDDEGRPEL
ncbi:MAG TPA: hypothetical protein VNA87_06605 [Actinomycetota bacterium]|nr:hypothetical protein [Actinomycetota bacterium]